jgi:hypothetical protein
LAAEFPRCGGVERFRTWIGIDTLCVSGGFAHERTAGALSGRGHVAIEARHPGDDDPAAAVGLEDDVAEAPVDGVHAGRNFGENADSLLGQSGRPRGAK